MGAEIALGLAAATVGALLVDYAISRPGESLAARLLGRLGSGGRPPGPGEGPPYLYAAAPVTRAPATREPVPARRSTMEVGPLIVSHPGAEFSAAEVADRLGRFFGLSVPGDAPAQDLAGLIAEFQAAMRIPPTGSVDPLTLRSLRNATSAPNHVAGAVALAPAASWEAEASPLGPQGKAVIAHAIAAEKDPGTLTALAAALGAAGFPTTAAAVRAALGAPRAAGWWPA